MSTLYYENPDNWDEFAEYVNKDTFAKDVFRRNKCFFYDTCSFRYHANLTPEISKKLLSYLKKEDGIIVITRCVLMELGSVSGEINPEYIRYIQNIDRYGIPVYVIYEEELLHVMEQCYSTNASINDLLSWAVKMIKKPVSTIDKTLMEDAGLYDEILKGKNRDAGNIYEHFFATVRVNKEPQDNLGEEMIGICLHILSNLPGEADGKFCVITDDKGAASKIDCLFKRTNVQYRRKKIIIYSTPKLAELLLADAVVTSQQELEAILGAGNTGNIKVLGVEVYDLECKEISLSVTKLAEKIMNQTLHVVF